MVVSATRLHLDEDPRDILDAEDGGWTWGSNAILARWSAWKVVDPHGFPYCSPLIEEFLFWVGGGGGRGNVREEAVSIAKVITTMLMIERTLQTDIIYVK